MIPVKATDTRYLRARLERELRALDRAVQRSLARKIEEVRMERARHHAQPPHTPPSLGFAQRLAELIEKLWRRLVP